jgi:hypothetical protein
MTTKLVDDSGTSAPEVSSSAAGSRPLVIFGADIDSPPHMAIEHIRCEIAKLRGQLGDISRAYPVWAEHLGPSEGGLTCVLVTLHDTKDEMLKSFAKWGHKRSWVRDENVKFSGPGGQS